MIQIKNRYTNEVIYTSEKLTLKETVEEAIKNGINLSYVDLRYADFRYADLRNADLRNADLSYADLSYADLSYVSFRNADLSDANFGNTVFYIGGRLFKAV